MLEVEKYFIGRDMLNQCYSYNQLYYFYRELGLKGIDRYINELQNESKSKSREIEKLNNKLKDIKSQLDYLETYSSKEDVFEDMKRRLDRIDKIIGSDKNEPNE